MYFMDLWVPHPRTCPTRHVDLARPSELGVDRAKGTKPLYSSDLVKAEPHALVQSTPTLAPSAPLSETPPQPHAFIADLESRPLTALSHRDLRTLQSFYKSEERRALAEHCAVLQALDRDPFDDDDPFTPHKETFRTMSANLRNVNRELARREYDRITSEWE